MGVVNVSDSGMRHGYSQCFWFRNETWVLSMLLIQEWDIGAINVSDSGMRHGCYQNVSDSGIRLE